MFDKKSKIILGSLFFISAGVIIAKGIYDYSTYKTLKWVEKRLKHNSWEYYE
jgi:hypothetical protein